MATASGGDIHRLVSFFHQYLDFALKQYIRQTLILTRIYKNDSPHRTDPLSQTIVSFIKSSLLLSSDVHVESDVK